MNQNQKIVRTFLKPALTGILSSAGAVLMWGFGGTTNILNLGLILPRWIAIGLSAMGSELIGQLANNFIIEPLLPQVGNLGMLIPPLSAGIGSVAICMFSNPPLAPSCAVTLMALAGGASLASNMLVESFAEVLGL